MDSKILSIPEKIPDLSEVISVHICGYRIAERIGNVIQEILLIPDTVDDLVIDCFHISPLAAHAGFILPVSDIHACVREVVSLFVGEGDGFPPDKRRINLGKIILNGDGCTADHMIQLRNLIHTN